MLERAIHMKEVLNYLCEERTEFIKYSVDTCHNIEEITEYLGIFNEVTLTYIAIIEVKISEYMLCTSNYLTYYYSAYPILRMTSFLKNVLVQRKPN
jgi:hypothetical protein